MIVGIGVDLVDVERMERSLRSPWANRLIKRIFSADEIGTCRRAPYPAQAFAARFAAKEALAKALGTGFSRGVNPTAITVVGRERQQPAIVLHSGALETARSMNIDRIHVSLTHTRTSACACVVLEKTE